MKIQENKIQEHTGTSFSIVKVDDISILKNVPIPQGSSLEIMQGNKIVVEAADTVTAKSDVNSTLDVALTIMEIT